MADSTDQLMEEIVCEVILGMCQLVPRAYYTVTDRIYVQVPRTCHVPIYYAMHCGSSAEFFIRPLNKLINDLDVLQWRSDELASTEAFPVLPNDVNRLHDTIKCFKIEPYLRYPGFVRLVVTGRIKYNWKCKKYMYVISGTALSDKYFTPFFGLASPGDRPITISGPSRCSQIDPKDIKTDDVHSVWCPQWPKEAQNWPKRPRSNGWPSDITVSEVLQQGFHVVNVQHRACRDDKQQYRLSFSIAEVILLQSWTKIQQLVYHLLRYLAQKELIEKDCPKEDEVLCNYHLKTLLLWACEDMSQEWWNSSSVVSICFELLKRLSEWFQRRRFPNYFIPEANLFYQPSRSSVLDKLQGRLMNFRNSDKLCRWLAENYIKPSFGIFYTTTTSGKPKLLDHMTHHLSVLRESRIGNALNILFEHVFLAYGVHFFNSRKWFGESSCLAYMHSLRNFALLNHSTLSILSIPDDVSFFRYLDIALFSLHARNELSCGKTSWDGQIFVESIEGILSNIKMVRCLHHNYPEPSNSAGSQFNFLKARKFTANLTDLDSPSKSQLVSTMAKEFLIRALECEDSQFNVIASAALVYLAALLFASGEFQKLIDLCSEVLIEETVNEENETLDGACLFFIDNVVRLVGFYLLCKKLIEKVHFCKKQIYLDLRLTPKVLAYHLNVRSAERMSIRFKFGGHLPAPIFALDRFLLALTKRKYSHSLAQSVTSFKSIIQRDYKGVGNAIKTLRMDPVRATENLVENLTEYALENLTLFYNAIRQDVDLQGNTVDCLRALHLYKRGKYKEVMHVCQRILQEPDLKNNFEEFSFANVFVVPPFDCLLDDDIRSLLGFNTLYCYLSLVNLREVEKHVTLFIPYFFTRFVFTVSDPLVGSCGLYFRHKCHYVVGTHFLARYLKLRCYIDCNLPHTKALYEFAAVKTIFLFEHIIRRFLLHKICRN